MQTLIGTGVALITPFNEDFSIDTQALKNIVHYNIENGTDYLVILGTTAESVTLSETEKKLVIQTIVEANNKKLPLVLGLGGNNTNEIVKTLKTTDFSDFVAILSVSPYYNKPTQEGIYAHFEAIAKASPLPIILYNVPGRTASNILPRTAIKLAQNHKNIIAIKEAAGDIVQAMQLIKNKPKDFLVISGDDMLAVPMVLAGGSGVISVMAQAFPKDFSTMIKLGLAKKTAEAFEIHYRFSDGIDMIFEQGNPAGIKAVFKILGFSSDIVRLPLVNVNEELSARIAKFCKTFS